MFHTTNDTLYTSYQASNEVTSCALMYFSKIEPAVYVYSNYVLNLV